MAKPLRLIALLTGMAFTAPTHAQLSAPPIPSALPNFASMSAGNAAGVLDYCIKNELVSTVVGGAVLEGLNKKPGLTKSADFTAGETGQVLTGGAKPFLVGQAPSYLQSQACDLVLKQAKTFL